MAADAVELGQRLEELEEALRQVAQAIRFKAADTLWMPNEINMTALEFIGQVLGEDLTGDA